MSNLLILGAGGHGRVVADAAIESRAWVEVAFADDFVAVGSQLAGCSVVARMSDLNTDWFRRYHLVVALGDNQRRGELYQTLAQQGARFANVIHPSAVVSRSVSLGLGVMVLANASINCDSTLGNNTIINTNAVVEHDCKVGSHTHIAPGSVVTGNVSIGEYGFIGAGATVIPGTTLGRNVTVGAGAAVVQSPVPDNAIAKGVPARW